MGFPPKGLWDIILDIFEKLQTKFQLSMELLKGFKNCSQNNLENFDLKFGGLII